MDKLLPCHVINIHFLDFATVLLCKHVLPCAGGLALFISTQGGVPRYPTALQPAHQYLRCAVRS